MGKRKPRQRPARHETKPVERRPVEPVIGDGSTFRAGHVAIVGRPNVGKSTILNQLLGMKVAATTHKPQTTRRNLLGMLNPEGAQILLLDTPGHHDAKGPFNRYMVGQAEEAIRDADVVAYVVEARTDDIVTAGNDRLLDVLLRSDKPIVLVINKVDRVADKKAMLHQIEGYRARLGDRMVACVPISATRRKGLEDLVRELGAALPVGEALYDGDGIVDAPERSIAAEFIREKVMLETKQELPYAVAVTIEEFDDQRPKIVRIMATVHVERESQKGIVIGRGGERLKAIGSRARKDVERLLESQVYLGLEVRVADDWRNDRRAMARLGYGGEESGRIDHVILEEVLSAAEEIE
jgi:GTP-binding protein Era